ncbi:short chain acyl-coenzyme A dehydrogenase [Obba rivulosa]|uniref:Short chain acyl-coenzyme A dehydrogenase n=1 Tax=Obba rivulosa TaxID=1052685 RepID=A0A8E2APD8_9APHY|nr:short chain acyl-coenzyme A dehydrogenase [Obba rivulosa]
MQAAAEIEATRLLTCNAERRKEADQSHIFEAATTQLCVNQVAQCVTGDDRAGGVGFRRETGVEKYWRDSKVVTIYEGTSNIQLQTIVRFIQKP